MIKSNLLKVVLVIVLSVLLIANLASVVFAADDSFASAWEDNAETPVVTSAGTDSTGTTTGTDSTGTTTGTDSTGTTTSTGTTDTTGTISGTDTTSTDTSSSISTGSATTTLSTNEDEDENKNEVHSLAYTGIEDNKILPVVIVFGAIVAGYSLKKVREYNNI